MRATLELSMPEIKGDPEVPLRAVLEQVERSGGGHDDRLDGGEVPEGCRFLWDRFWSFYRDERITYTELDAYGRLTGDVLTRLEVKAIMAMDQAAANYMAERLERMRKK